MFLEITRDQEYFMFPLPRVKDFQDTLGIKNSTQKSFASIIELN
jgi:hypothetical protein